MTATSFHQGQVTIPISVLDLDQFKAMERRLVEAESVIDELQIQVSDLAEENDRFRKAFKTLRSELGGLL